jgi:hypothetical protein
MKHIISSFVTRGLILGLMGTAMFAQTTSHTPPTPQQMAQRRVQMLTNFLTLSSTQQSDALTYFTASATANAAVEATLKAAHQALVTAIQTNSGIGAAASAIANAEAQITTNNATADAQLYLVLNQQQQAKFTTSLGHGGFGGGMGGPQFRGRPQQ